ncbi:MAG: hypothetical protein HOO06_03500 [Bdellovibrionaceae bacterium]|nr:hypothetical protein [Pseudobdellovibrionaceae bacterium]
MALNGGPAIVASTGPRFELKVSKGEGLCHDIHPKSLAGLWMRANAFDFSNVDIEFIDPYEGKGGFGASSAEFLLVYIWSEYLKNQSDFLNKLDLQHLWSSYRELSLESGASVTPSGIDVIGQLLGGISKVQWQEGRLTKVGRLNWNFESQSFCLLKTTKKVNTHEHLAQLDIKGDDFSDLLSVVNKAEKAFKNNDAFHLLVCLETYYQSLMARGLVHQNTQNIVKQLKAAESILGAKGCGAMGADVIWVLCETEKLDQLQNFFKVVGLEMVATEKNLSTGVEMKASLEGVKIDLNYDLKIEEEKNKRALKKSMTQQLLNKEAELTQVNNVQVDSGVEPIPVEGYGVEGIDFIPDFSPEEPA